MKTKSKLNFLKPVIAILLVLILTIGIIPSVAGYTYVINKNCFIQFEPSVKTLTYNGKYRRPSIEAYKIEGEGVDPEFNYLLCGEFMTDLKPNSDYKLSWSNNKNVGKATIIIKFTKYGTKKAYFNIIPKASSVVSKTVKNNILSIKFKNYKGTDAISAYFKTKGKTSKWRKIKATKPYTIRNVVKGQTYTIKYKSYNRKFKFYSTTKTIKVKV